MVFRKVPAGTYKMGYAETSLPYQWHNSPHDVIVPTDYYIGIYMLTRGQFKRIMADATEDSAYPYDKTSWNGIRGSAGAGSSPTSGALFELGKKLKAQGFNLGAGFDLPTESMWEIAARAGTTTRNFWGDNVNLIGDYAWYAGNTKAMQKVGLKKPNQWGLYDCIGNAWEIMRDVGHERTVDVATLTAQTKNALQPITSGRSGYTIQKGGAYFDTTTSRTDCFVSGAWLDKTVGATQEACGFRIAYIK